MGTDQRGNRYESWPAGEVARGGMKRPVERAVAAAGLLLGMLVAGMMQGCRTFALDPSDPNYGTVYDGTVYVRPDGTTFPSTRP
ncbi:MAG: hypothetical protein QM783_13715 [Phycisphaerales bacterium]